jgi:TolB protein
LSLLALLVLVALLVPYPYSQFFEKTVSSITGSNTIAPRYMSEVNGIETPEDMRRQYDRHPAEYKFAIDDDLVVMFAYPDANIQWVGMVFIHHFPSVSEVILDYEGNKLHDQVSSPEAQLRMDDLLKDEAFFAECQIQMSGIWGLNDPGAEVVGLVDSLKATGNMVEFLGGRPQTLFEASMYLIRVNNEDIMVYEFDDETARGSVSDNISPDGYEFTQQEGDVTTVIHVEYLGQPNFWAKDRLLVQYLGTDQTILELLTTELGKSITTHNLGEQDTLAPVYIWQLYSNPYFKISFIYPAHWQQVDGEARYGERYSGEDGFFSITAMGDVGLSLDQAVEAEVQHKLQPYGPDPYVKELQIQGQEARIITPSATQDDHLRWQAALLVVYPRPISLITGDTEHVYPILALYADPAHIWNIAESLKFDVDLFEASETPTSFPVCTPPACAPDEMYHCPGDCPGGCGTVCATATPGVSTGSGQVWGEICFPGETTPEMTIYFQEINTQQTLEFPVTESQDSYQLNIPAGVYVAFAWLSKNDSGGGYTQLLRCNQNISSCDDHSLVPFLVRENHVTIDVDICDWETDNIEFPMLPEE